ncbi:hypothetical protein [Synechococcus sp. CCY 9618]|uniref:hypothetical protein n=1 Tax=Synechococcus sp. CCY 9618 TaxID=2815602 RepID=UPI001C211582|nr:hypothetical protein [Synechococcus sp. CCY 9618]
MDFAKLASRFSTHTLVDTLKYEKLCLLALSLNGGVGIPSKYFQSLAELAEGFPPVSDRDGTLSRMPAPSGLVRAQAGEMIIPSLLIGQHREASSASLP